MMKNRRIAVLFAFLILVSLFLIGCSNKAGTGTGTANTATSPEAAVIPADPRETFITGAKQLLSTDVVKLLTEEEDGTYFVGMLSEMLNDLNNKTAHTRGTLTLTDLVESGEPVDEEIFLSLDALHDSGTGDTSTELSLGMGTETAQNVGIYITGNNAVLKPGSISDNILLYTLPEVPGASTSFFDKASILLTGLFSEDGKATLSSSNVKDRAELCSRYLDPWLTETATEDYTDAQMTMTLAGKEVPLRSVTLSMTGQRAYDFVLKNTTAVAADTQFSSMDKLLGTLSGIASRDLGALLQSVMGGGDTPTGASSAAGELLSELQALTPDEIAAAKFVVSILYNNDKPIGINLEAATTGKAFIFNALIYRNGLEHELDLTYQSIHGEKANIKLSTAAAGGDAYDVSGTLLVVNSDGMETYSGGYTGKLTETKTDYALTAVMDITLQIINDEGAPQKARLGGDLNLNIAHNNGAYKATGTMTMSVLTDDEESLSAKALLDASLEPSDSVTIKPPMYTSANVTTVTNKKDLWAIHADDLGNMDDYNGFTQDMMLFFSFIMG